MYRPNDHVLVETLEPAAVVSGVRGAYPSLHVVFRCRGDGEPRPLEGETSDTRWWEVDAVRRLLAERPDAFVWHSHAMLSRAL